MPDRAHLEALATQLEASGDYRVLRKLRQRDQLPSPPPGARLGLVLDVETTGADLRGDEVIELAMVRFVYSPEGEVLGIQEIFQGYHQPSKPISAEITALTGIDAATVAGHKLDLDRVGAFVAPSAIVVAHNAAFDRRFAERLPPYFSTKAWGCSMSEPPWREEGFEGLKLSHLAAQCGFFYDKHQALQDCLATLEILARPLPSGRTALAALLERARRPSWRLWAENAPFEHKDVLKARGYRWSGGDDGRPRAWWTDVDQDMVEAELDWLRSNVYGYEAEVPQRRLTAFDRYSERA
ncbi:3'-5' exonuclease [Caulobacter sp. S45]|uniref:3'-5' exonuclease n=1 Tax=Caulobacter sp. S45 TaxID=1641861 RepID=UPI00131D6B8C|nr:3'-5' exonuclease [Caulobacter sp. S45]